VKHFRPKSAYMPAASALSVLFLPSFLFDILKTNLPDAVYLMFCLYSFQCFVKKRRWPAWLLLGFGICFKLMAIYLAPVYIYFYVKNFHRYKFGSKLSPLSGIFALILCSLPYMICGGGFFNAIIGPSLNRTDDAMRMNSFSLWTFLPNDMGYFKLFSIALLAMTMFATAYYIFHFMELKKRRNIEYPLLPTLSAALCYFILPAQHESFFTLAAVFSLIGFAIMVKKPYLIIFILLNALLFFAYAWVGFNWWIGDSVFFTEPIIAPILAIAFAFTIGYCYYLIFFNSTLSPKYKSSGKP